MGRIIQLAMATVIFIGCNYQAPNKALADGLPGLISPILNCNSAGNGEIQNPLPDLSLSSFEKLYAFFLEEFIVICDNQGHFDTRVNYPRYHQLFLKKNPKLTALRDALRDKMGSEDLTGKSKNYKLAFYTNAYNFIAIDKIIQHSGQKLIKSIADIGGTQSFNVFSKDRYGEKVAGENLTLDEIEKDRAAQLHDWCDGRAHFAFICASIGCPVLLDKPYNETEVQAQYTFITKAGLKLKRMFHNQDEQSFLSEIFSWYSEDFKCELEAEGRSFSSIREYKQAYIRKYTEPAQIFHLNNIQSVPYNWDINSSK